MNRSLNSVLHYTRNLVDGGDAVPDFLLLERFLSRHEEAAFTSLVERHGPMVLGVCRRLLGHAHDAEDAFQAVFFTLAHHASSIRKHDSLASWLHGVACRIAWRARASIARRRTCERLAQTGQPSSGEPLAPDLAEVLDQELQRLPAKYRTPVVLCYLQGQTREQAAEQLGWPVGTVKGRLSRACDLLRTRLTRRGLAPSLVLPVAPSCLPPSLTQTTLDVAFTSCSQPAAVAALAKGALETTAWARLKPVLAALVLVTALGGGAGALLLRGAAPPVPPTPPVRGDGIPVAAADDPPARNLDSDLEPLPRGARARLGSSRFRHGSSVDTIAYAPDGKIIASAGGDRTICLWDAGTGKLIRRFVAHPRGCTQVVFSPDGKLLASVGWEGTQILLSEVATGKEVTQLPGHNRYTHAVAFSPNGKQVASVGSDGQTLLWDVATGKVARRLPDTGRHPCCVTFSHDGKKVAAGGHSYCLFVWDAATGKELLRLPSPGSAVISVDFSHECDRIATGDMSGRAVLWEAKTGKQLRKWTDHKGYLYTVRFSSDDRNLVVCSYRSLDLRSPVSLRLYDVNKGHEAIPLQSSWGSMKGAAFSPDGKILAAAAGNTIRRWDTKTGRELRQTGHRGSLMSVAVSPDGKIAYSGCKEASVRGWDTVTGKELFDLSEHDQCIYHVQLSADGKLLASTGGDSRVCLWNALTGRALRQFEVGGQFRAFALAPDGRTLVAGNDSRGLGFWDVATGKEIRRTGNGSMFYCLTYSRDGKILGAGGYQGGRGQQQVLLLDVATGKSIGLVEGLTQPRSVSFHPTGYLLAAAFDGRDNLVQLHSVPGGAVIRQLRGHSGGVCEVAFSPDGHSLVSASRDGTIRLWETATGQERRRLEGHCGEIQALALSADGQTVVSGGEDTTVLVWDLADGVKAHRRGKPPTAARLAQCVEDLVSPSAPRAYDAMEVLAAFPDSSVPPLRERLLKVRETVGRVARLIDELDDDDFKVRDRAMGELRKLGPLVEPDLRAAATRGMNSLELQRRLERLLEGLGKSSDPWESSEGLRTIRALEVLERAGTVEARKTLEVLAGSKTTGALKSAATAALERLKRYR